MKIKLDQNWDYQKLKPKTAAPHNVQNFTNQYKNAFYAPYFWASMISNIVLYSNHYLASCDLLGLCQRKNRKAAVLYILIKIYCQSHFLLAGNVQILMCFYDIWGLTEQNL